jgi:putative ABC transport system substrate-binding protein
MHRNLSWLVTPLVLLAFLDLVEAQQPVKIYRIGYLSATSEKGLGAEALRLGLRKLGYVDDRDMVLEKRFAHGEVGRLLELAQDLVRTKPDVIVTSDIQSTHAAIIATKTIPIVFAIADNPVESKIVLSLAKPEGNATGITDFADELSVKRVELLKESFPSISRLAVIIWKPDGPGNSREREEIESAARRSGIQVIPLEIQKQEELEPGFSRIAKVGAHALIGLTDTRFSYSRLQIVDLSIKHRLACVYPDRQFVEVGGLMSYATNRAEWRQRLAVYVDKILKGFKPADLPVEQPTKFELVINLKTAKQIGLTIQPQVLARADKVIR